MIRPWIRSLGCLGLFCLIGGLLSGCGGPTELPLGTVSGTVTLNGDPLSDANIVFSPTGDGQPSYGKTDTQGKYSLIYKGNFSGAVVGPHRVGISTRDPEAVNGQEKVPLRYNQESELREEVEKGDNVIDFQLEGDAPAQVAPAQRSREEA